MSLLHARSFSHPRYGINYATDCWLQEEAKEESQHFTQLFVLFFSDIEMDMPRQQQQRWRTILVALIAGKFGLGEFGG